MANTTGKQLAQGIRQKVDELAQVCQGIDEADAGKAPEGRWSPKEILSHLCGPEGLGLMPFLRAFLDQDTPRLDIVAEDPFLSAKRARMTLTELVAEARKEYEGMAEFAAGLSEEELQRKAHVPLFKETPLGEYPTLGGVIGGLGSYHMQFHTDHLREVLKAS